MKLCKTCNTFRPLTSFHKRGDSEGLRSNCKNCAALRSTRNRRKKGILPRTKMSVEQQRINARLACKRYHQKPESKIKQAAQEARRRSTKLNATPYWLTAEQLAHIECYYELANILSECFGVQMDVDHIIPLRGKEVKGLHVPWNLQIMEHTANGEKSNKVVYA